MKRDIVEYFNCVNCAHEKNSETNDLTSSGYLLKDSVISNENALKFFGREYSSSVWLSDIKYLILLARKEILHIEQCSYKTDAQFQSTNFLEKRKCICDLWWSIHDFTFKWKNNKQYEKINNELSILLSVVPELKNLKSLPEYILHNSSTAKISNINNHAAFNLVHLYLDLYWVNLLLVHNFEEDTGIKLKNFEKQLHLLLSDLIYISMKKFDKVYSSTHKISPFYCSCFKELWLLIQLHVEKLHSQHFCKDFWHYFNAAVTEILNLENVQELKYPICSLWLTYNIASIQGFDDEGKYKGPQHYRVVSNYLLIEKSLKILLSNNTNEQLLRSSLKYVSCFQMIWWKQDITFDLFTQLWEYFYRHINMPFVLSNETSINLGTVYKTYNFIEILESIKKCDTETNNSYEIFLWMLGNYLSNNSSYWPKFRGRIYSKLPVSKIANFTDAGLQHFILLLLSLAEYVNFEELTQKLCSLLNQLPATLIKENPVIWSAFISLIQLNIKRSQSVQSVSINFLPVVQQASVNRSKAQLIRLYVDAITEIVDEFSSFQSQEHLLFGDWIKNYLQWCSHTDACDLLNTLALLVDKINLLANSDTWWKVLNTHVVPSILQMANSVDAPVQLANVAAALISIDPKNCNVLLERLAGDTTHPNISLQFLRKLLVERSDVEFTEEQQIVMIQAWTRILVLNVSHIEFLDVTEKISQLPHWTKNFESLSMYLTDDPFCTLIKFFGAKMQRAQNVSEGAAVKRSCEMYFGKMDRWANTALASTDKEDSTQNIMRIYTCAALLFLHCSSAIYTKNKTNCLFYRLTSTLLLTSGVLMNKKPANTILEAIRHTWHMFVRGIAQLDYQNDVYIKRALSDMVVRYVPHMNDSESPILRCLDTEFSDELTNIVIEKISTTFVGCKARSTHEFSSQGLHMIQEFILRCYDSNKMTLLLKNTLPNLFEQIIFVENNTNKNVILKILELIKYHCNNEQFSDIFKVAMSTTFDKYLAFYSSGVFHLLNELINVIPTEVSNVLKYLNEAISKVERMRGVGYDNTLRKGYETVQETLKTKLKC